MQYQLQIKPSAKQTNCELIVFGEVQRAARCDNDKRKNVTPHSISPKNFSSFERQAKMLANIARSGWKLPLQPLGPFVRYASLNSAIGRGIRREAGYSDERDGRESERRGRDSRFSKDQYEPRKYGKRQYAESNDSNSNRRQTFRQSNDSPFTPRARSEPFPDSPRNDQGRRFSRRDKSAYNEFDQDEFIRTGSFQGLPREHQSRFREREPRRDRDTPFGERKPTFREHESQFRDREPRFDRRQDASFGRQSRDRPEAPKEKESKSRAHKVTRGMPERVKENVKVPDTVPYTTPASEFIYGTSAVEAALRCSRRQLYKLYIYQAAEEELSAGKVTIRKLALSKNVGVKMAFAGWDRLMDKMSAGRPHNGCILEASPLPKLPVRGFQAVDSISEENFRVELAPQTREEAAVNGTDDRVPIHQPPPPHEGQRYPVALLLDGVVDPGNMGAIIRSSYFLGIDAIVLAGRNSAPLSPVTIKASAGAAENMPILHVRNEVDFIQRSQKNGWKFYAADALGPGSVSMDASSGNLPIMTSPSVVMMGSEGSGLSSHIKSHADATVSIPGARHSPVLGVQSDPARIDSLNVSVAAALLMEKFLQTPLAVAETPKREKKETVKMW
ncbi:hypothetical protein PENANT_c001G03084 [Penicillium antarcticum]|uniref:rRNA methyltransferase 1, mitochondrial n=1 Tax=Penicillium antarcticum TaxID=416450 RepID=A0A1V6QP15_9EURO|nr:uncharacterized protein N7508_010755 [Penicillium antarcticum]KAJ5295934.1 hypothetical protein N7508_010755 [Penicillium antarcticum]OQD90974.1 hypothetical protein PENANT_c001G03084 [Penicillium antarcticum]